MKRSPLRRRKPSKGDPGHKAASRLAHESKCLLCGAKGTCVPAHFPHHRARRTFAEIWDRRNWVPLCGQPGACHDYADWRVGGSRPADCRRRDAVRALILERAKAWWEEPA